MGRSIFYPFHTTNVDMASALVYKLGKVFEHNSFYKIFKSRFYRFNEVPPSSAGGYEWHIFINTGTSLYLGITTGRFAPG